jgi:hypothetical protein
MYWNVPSETVKPTGITRPGIGADVFGSSAVKTTETEVFVGTAGAAPGPM